MWRALFSCPAIKGKRDPSSAELPSIEIWLLLWPTAPVWSHSKSFPEERGFCYNKLWPSPLALETAQLLLRTRLHLYPWCKFGLDLGISTLGLIPTSAAATQKSSAQLLPTTSQPLYRWVDARVVLSLKTQECTADNTLLFLEKPVVAWSIVV